MQSNLHFYVHFDELLAVRTSPSFFKNLPKVVSTNWVQLHVLKKDCYITFHLRSVIWFSVLQETKLEASICG